MVWWRYIDDVFTIWTHGEDSLKEFIAYLNDIHPTLKFTFKYSKTQTEFLDVNVIKEGNSLKTDLFIKDTDTHQYLHAKSCHTYHTKKGIPYGQALRIRRIVSDDSVFLRRCGDLEDWLVKRGHEKRLVENEISKAKDVGRDDLLKEKTTTDQDDRLNLVLRYHPALSRNVHDIIKKHLTILQLNEQHKKVFSEAPRVTFRRAKNLKDNLVRASLPKSKQIFESGCCGKKRCQVGDNLLTTSHFTDSEKKKNYEIRSGPLNCDTPNVVYQMQCKVCDISYVGSAQQSFRVRFNNYKSAHRNFLKGKTENLSQLSFHQHFAGADHNGFFSDATFKLIDSAPDHTQVLKKEAFWMRKLDTYEPKGLNIREVVT